MRREVLLTAQNLKKEYGMKDIFEIKKIEIQDGMRIGLVGKNGTGKSTLLGVLTGRIPCDEGQVSMNCEIAEIRQDAYVEEEEYAEGSFISRMHLKDSNKFSGGEKTRYAIATAFSKHAPLLFADEPTTNLDVEGIETIEKMLAGYRGAVVLVSHDRMLLDRICNEIWELEDGELRCFPGNYSDWLEQRDRERKFQQFEYESYRKEKNRLEHRIMEVRKEANKAGKPPKRMSQSEWILYKNTAAIQQGHVQKQAAGMTTRLEQLEEKEKPKELPNVSMKLPKGTEIKTKFAARVAKLSVSYGEQMVLGEVTFDIESGKKTFLVGENGTGKSTVIKQLIERMPETFITSEAKVGYFSQEQDNLDFEKTVLENVKRDAVVPEHICRAVLKNLYLSDDDMFKKINVLSGGERVKTALAKVLVSGCNFIILDEPTNHMDVYTMEGLEALLKDYDGTLFIVSHDRKFVENLADEVFEVKDKKVEKR